MYSSQAQGCPICGKDPKAAKSVAQYLRHPRRNDHKRIERSDQSKAHHNRKNIGYAPTRYRLCAKQFGYHRVAYSVATLPNLLKAAYVEKRKIEQYV